MMQTTYDIPIWMIDVLLALLPHVNRDRLAPRGGSVFTSFYRVEELMAAEHEQLDWIDGPLADRADYLTKSYHPFLMIGPNHRIRREQIVARMAVARAHLEDLEAMLGREADLERALVRFLFRHFGRLEATSDDVDRLLDYRTWGGRLLFLPKWLRTSVFRATHERLQSWRASILERIEAAGEPLADSLFDVIWFQSMSLGFYAKTALGILRDRPDLLTAIRGEIDAPPGQRPKTVSLVREVLRLHTRQRATYYVYNEMAEIASIARASVDHVRYAAPDEIDLERDHDADLVFAGPSRGRGCPASALAPEMIACAVARELRAELEKGVQPAVSPMSVSLQAGAAAAATCPVKVRPAGEPVAVAEAPNTGR